MPQPVSLDHLFAIASDAPMLDGVESALRAGGHIGLADALFKLQQDAGVQIDREMSGEMDMSGAGPQAKKLYDAFKPVTQERLGILRDIHAKLEDTSTKQKFTALMEQIGVPAQPVFKAQAPKMGR